MRSAILVLVIVVSVSLCGLVLSARAQSADLQKVLSEFPDYHVLRLEERDNETRAFIRLHFPKTNSSVVHADFDGDGHLDYALLLRDNRSGATKLVVLLCSTSPPCRNVYDLDLASDGPIAYVRPVPAGSRVSETGAIDTGDSAPSVKVGSTAIRLTYFEKAAVVLYWNKKHKKIEEVQTED